MNLLDLVENNTKETLVKMVTKLDSNIETKNLNKIELVQIISKKTVVSNVNEINIRDQKVTKNFQRYILVAGMLKAGQPKENIIERYMAETDGTWATVDDKAKAEESAKNFIGKISSCFNAYNDPNALIKIQGQGVLQGHMRTLFAGRVPKGPSANYAKLTFRSLQ